MMMENSRNDFEMIISNLSTQRKKYYDAKEKLKSSKSLLHENKFAIKNAKSQMKGNNGKKELLLLFENRKKDLHNKISVWEPIKNEATTMITMNIHKLFRLLTIEKNAEIIRASFYNACINPIYRDFSTKKILSLIHKI